VRHCHQAIKAEEAREGYMQRRGTEDPRTQATFQQKSN
jgi:hypothetical protein